MANNKDNPKPVVCDDCLNAVYDEIGSSDVSQAEIAIQVGDMLPDHICDEVEHNGEYSQCACSCKRHAKMKIRAKKEHWSVEAVTGEGKTQIVAQFILNIDRDNDERKVGEFW
jgi:hypothetical protein